MRENIDVRKRNIDWLPPVCALTGDQTRNLGICPDWGLNLPPFGVQQHSSTFLAPGAGFVEDSFSMDFMGGG